MKPEYRELRPEYRERTWRVWLRHADAVNWRYREDPEEFAKITCYRVADYRAALRTLRALATRRDTMRITRQVPATGYPRTIYLAPDWEADRPA